MLKSFWIISSNNVLYGLKYSIKYFLVSGFMAGLLNSFKLVFMTIFLNRLEYLPGTRNLIIRYIRFFFNTNLFNDLA